MTEKPPRFRGIARLSHKHGHGPGEHTHEDARGGEPLRFGNARLERGAGVGKLLYFDCFAGVAGDMSVAALLDLGVPLEVVRDAVAAVGLAGIHVSVEAGQAGAVGGLRFVVEQVGRHPERSYAEICRLLANAAFDDSTRSRAQAIFRRLAEAEAQVHRTALESVTFHEVGAVDAIADIVGAAAALEYLGAELVCSPLPLGHGSITCSHGVLPLPAPATVACLRGAPTYDAQVEAELVTPTGAAIVASQASRFERWPSLIPIAVGWGAGTRKLPDRLNALRVVFGTPQAFERAPWAEGGHFVLEANLDDPTGEAAARIMAALVAAGALDAWAVPVCLVGGRSGQRVAALANVPSVSVLAAVLARETPGVVWRRSAVSGS